MNKKIVFKYHISRFRDKYKEILKKKSYYFDEYGVLMTKFDETKNKVHITSEYNLKHYYHPCAISQFAIAICDIMIESPSDDLEHKFWNQISWLESNYTEYKNSYVYTYPFAVASFGEEPHWISGMSQGQILSCFVRAYIKTKDLKYLTFCEKVYNSYSLELGDKYGCRVKDEYGLWFEEAMLNPPTHILNGFIFAIFGLIDFYTITQREDVKQEIDDALKTVENTLPLYDMGYWSYYDLIGNIASYNYNSAVHVQQLFSLYNYTLNPTYKVYAQKFERYGKSKYCKFRKKVFVVCHKLVNLFKNN